MRGITRDDVVQALAILDRAGLDDDARIHVARVLEASKRFLADVETRAERIGSEARAAYLEALRVGVHPRHAAEYAGVAHEAMLRIRKVDAAFDLTCRQAVATKAVEWLEGLTSSGETRALMWALERRFPKQYGPRRGSAASSVAAPSDAEELTDEQLLARLRE